MIVLMRLFYVWPATALQWCGIAIRRLLAKVNCESCRRRALHGQRRKGK